MNNPAAAAFAKASTVVAHALALRKTYEGGRVAVLDNATFDVFASELVAIFGPSGSGKSTLLHLLGGLVAPEVGELSICGLDPKIERDRLTLRREHLGFVFQQSNLVADLTVEQNIRLPAIAAGIARGATTARVREVAAAVGIAHLLNQRIHELSSGERQRVAIGRALMNRPQLILADEPTGSLDEETAETIFALLRTLVKEQGVAILFATHERRLAEQCDRLLCLRMGKIEIS